ncbi:MAG: hypothetical protein ACOC32_02630 [Nanoarchaeota archaeon]
MHDKKGQIWVSAILYTMVAAISIAFILQAGMPLIEGMRDRSVFTRMKNQMMVLDQHIEQVASEGRGSQRFVPFEITQGSFRMDDDGLRWNMETETKIVEPRSSYNVGNLVISANSDVTAREYSDHYLLRNSEIEVRFHKNGTRDAPAANLSTSDFIERITILDSNTTISDPSFEFTLAGDPTSRTGSGYTALTKKGTLLGSAAFVANMDTENYAYELYIVLEGDADYVRTEVKNFRPKQ